MFDREALEFLFGQAQTDEIEIDGRKYTTKPVYLVEPKMPAQIQVNTLEAVVDYLNSGIDLHGDVFVHVVDPMTVDVFTAFNGNGRRVELIRAKAHTGFMQFGQFMDVESFIIRLQAGFTDTLDRHKVIGYVANIDHEHTVKTTDNGLSQKAVVKVGIVDKEEVAVPNPVKLAPYRSFIEVDQPMSDFILRLKNEGTQAALFEADGGAWKLEAVENVAEYLHKQLEDSKEQRTFRAVLLA